MKKIIILIILLTGFFSINSIELFAEEGASETYTITYNSNGGTEQTDLTEQTNLPDPLPTPTKEDYTFGGWYYDVLFTHEATAGDELTADVTLYAKWDTPTEPEIPKEEPTDEPFLTANQIILLVVSLIMYILAIFISVLTNNKLLIASSGLLWVIPIIVIDNFIIRVFCAIVILASFMILTKGDKEEYYE